MQIVLKQLQSQLARYNTQGDQLAFAREICEADNVTIPPTNVRITQFILGQGHGKSSNLMICRSRDGYSSDIAWSAQPDIVVAEAETSSVKSPAELKLASVNLAWALTLAAFSGTKDVSFGLTTSGRSSDTLATNYIFGH